MRSLCLLVAALLALAVPPVHAEDEGPPQRLPCFSYGEVARQLKGTYEEAPVSLGLQANGNLLQVFNSATSGSWTIVSTSPDGMACILAAGRNWENLKPGEPRPVGLTRPIPGLTPGLRPVTRAESSSGGAGWPKSSWLQSGESRKLSSFSWHVTSTPRTAIRSTNEAPRRSTQAARGHPLARAWLIREGGRVVGYAVLGLGFGIEYGGADAFVDDLYLVPEARGRGLGQDRARPAGGAGSRPRAGGSVPGGRSGEHARLAALSAPGLRGHALAADGQAAVAAERYSHSSCRP